MEFTVFTLEVIRAIAWPAAMVGVVYIVAQVLGKIEIPNPDDKVSTDAKPPARPFSPRIQVRPTANPKPNEAPPS